MQSLIYGGNLAICVVSQESTGHKMPFPRATMAFRVSHARRSFGFRFVLIMISRMADFLSLEASICKPLFVLNVHAIFFLGQKLKLCAAPWRVVADVSYSDIAFGTLLSTG